MNMRHRSIGLAPMLSLFLSCTGARHHQQDLITDPFPEAQAELREVVQSIARDIMTGLARL